MSSRGRRPTGPSSPPDAGGAWQIAAVVGLLLVAGGTGYYLRMTTLAGDSSATSTAAQSDPAGNQASPGSSVGDLSTFRTITQDPLDLLNAGNQSDATTRIADLEYEWDTAKAELKPEDITTWTVLDGKIDTVLRELRAANPNPSQEQAALNALLTALG